MLRGDCRRRGRPIQHVAAQPEPVMAMDGMRQPVPEGSLRGYQEDSEPTIESALSASHDSQSEGETDPAPRC